RALLFGCAAEKTNAHARYFFSLALRPFIFHANQWLVFKAMRRARTRRVIPPPRRVPRTFFATVASGFLAL
ncbi:MAG TPA: hypothetical protein VHT02_02980, partial [Methylocella sp.]|nr:hypothetical protein [Methylocella sp.]